jgi:ParB family chromosome partitioning protein
MPCSTQRDERHRLRPVGEDSYFADGEAFWTAQNAAIEARREAYLEAGWADVVVPPGEHFHSWEYEKAPKRKGGRVYIEVRGNGEVIFMKAMSRAGGPPHRARRGRGACESPRPEVTGPMQCHRPASPCRLRAALIDHGGLALR